MIEQRAYLRDCMDAMAEFPDKFFDLAVVDPPYGLGDRLTKGGKKLQHRAMTSLYKGKNWDAVPTLNYWNLLFKKSKNQIVFGANYFLEYLPSSRGIICWDKNQFMPTFSAWELAWTSFDKPAKIYKKESLDLDKIHPTQKPIALYDWIFANYAKPGQKILDTHLGSGSSRIAANKAGLDFWGYELDADYFAAHEKRYANFIAQLRLF